jgi:hypothetical protein
MALRQLAEQRVDVVAKVFVFLNMKRVIKNVNLVYRKRGNQSLAQVNP